MAARAVILALAGRGPRGARGASEAAQMAERLHYPLGAPRRSRRRGGRRGSGGGARLLAQAEAAWVTLDRPLEATRSRLSAGQMLPANPR